MQLAIVAVLCVSASLALGQSVDECRDGRRSMHDCMKTAMQQAVGATVDKEQGRELFKQCLTENGCSFEGRGGGDRGDHREEMQQCMTGQLGFDPHDRVKDCMSNAGHPPPDDDDEEGRPPGRGHHRRGHHGGPPFMKFAHKRRMLERLCASGGNLQGALSCIRDKTGLDLDNVDPEAIRTALCAAKPNCDAMLPAGCEDVLRADMQSKHGAMCLCHQSLADEVGRDALQAAFEACKPDFGGRGGRGGRFSRGGPGHRGGPMKFLDMDCDAIGTDEGLPPRDRPDFCADDFRPPPVFGGRGGNEVGARGGRGQGRG